MVAPAVTHRETLTQDLTRALDHATAERIVVYKVDAHHLGVAAISPAGAFVRKPYTLTVTGEGAGALTCDCQAAANGRTCKHLAAGLLTRKYGVYAKRPVPATSGNPLLDCCN